MSKYKIGQKLNVIVESIDENGKAKFRVLKEDWDDDSYEAERQLEIVFEEISDQLIHNKVKGLVVTGVDHTNYPELKNKYIALESNIDKFFDKKIIIGWEPYDLDFDFTKIGAERLNDYFCSFKDDEGNPWGDFGIDCYPIPDALDPEGLSVWVSLLFVKKNKKVVPILAINRYNEKNIDLIIDSINHFGTRNVALDSL